MRTKYKILDRVFGYLGLALILGTLLFSASTQLQVGLVIIGILLVQMSVHRAAESLIPSTRTHPILRHEVENYLRLVRFMYREIESDGGENLLQRHYQMMIEQTRRVVEAAHKEKTNE